MTSRTSARGSFIAYAASLAVIAGLTGIVVFGGSAITAKHPHAAPTPQLAASNAR